MLSIVSCRCEVVENYAPLLLPGGLLRRSGEYGHCFELIETTSDRCLIVLPSGACGVVYKGAVTERICASSGLSDQRSSRGLWPLLLLGLCW